MIQLLHLIPLLSRQSVFSIFFNVLICFISNMTNGKVYCGQLLTRRSGRGSIGSIAEKHDWSLTSDCLAQNPFVCEAPLSKKERTAKKTTHKFLTFLSSQQTNAPMVGICWMSSAISSTVMIPTFEHGRPPEMNVNNKMPIWL